MQSGCGTYVTMIQIKKLNTASEELLLVNIKANMFFPNMFFINVLT